jgi:hypothetical protein
MNHNRMSSMLKIIKINLVGLAVFFFVDAYSQVVISSGTIISVANNPDVVIQTASNITNNSSFDFSPAQLHLSLVGSSQIKPEYYRQFCSLANAG